MAWHLAPSLAVLRDEVNRRWPNRDKASDGTIGDAAHQATASDHNPNGRDSVNAIDLDRDGISVAEVIAAAQAHPSVHYWIFNREIADRDDGWRRRRYTGSNPHDKHVHISIRQTKAAEQDRRPWGLIKEDTMTAAEFLALLKTPAVAAELSRLPWAFKPAEAGGETAHGLVLQEMRTELDVILKAVSGDDSAAIIAAIREQGEQTRAAILAQLRDLAPGLAAAVAEQLGPEAAAGEIGEALARELAAMLTTASPAS